MMCVLKDLSHSRKDHNWSLSLQTISFQSLWSIYLFQRKIYPYATICLLEWMILFWVTVKRQWNSCSIKCSIYKEELPDKYVSQCTIVFMIWSYLLQIAFMPIFHAKHIFYENFMLNMLLLSFATMKHSHRHIWGN